MKSCFVIKMLSLDLLLKLPLSTLLVIFAELMILGFISLLLTFGQNYIIQICIPEEAADTMLPCSRKTDTETEEEADGRHRRRLLTNALTDPNVKRRILAAGSIVSCSAVSTPIKKFCDFNQIAFACSCSCFFGPGNRT